jgi:peptidoglycan/xylan/chitin deacetylase (PgdA/CDA1 family)
MSRSNAPLAGRGVLLLSASIHLLALVLIALPGHRWALALALVLANHLVLTGAGLWPRCRLLGPNHTRLGPHARVSGAVALTIDDGPDPAVTPQVLELLERYRARATFFCIGERVSAHAGLALEILRRGHEIENHTQHHRVDFSLLGPGGMRREISEAQAAIGATLGVRPRYFRAPAGLRNPFLQPVLALEGLELVTWTRRGFDSVARNPTVVLSRLTRNLRAGDILLLHDGHAARDEDGVPVILSVLPKLLATIDAAGLSTVTLEGALE